MICWFVSVWVVCFLFRFDGFFGFCFCFSFLTLSLLLFTGFHFFPHNLRLKSEILDHLIVLPDAYFLYCNVRHFQLIN